jgi:hypothetical protein
MFSAILHPLVPGLFYWHLQSILSLNIIRPVQCHRDIQGTLASVPRANNLTSIGAYVGGSSPRLLDMDFAASLYVGLLNAPGDIPIGCATGNCRFPIEAASGASYQTLGFESTCVDVSAEIRSYMPDFSKSLAYYIPRFGNGSYVSGDVDMRDVDSASQVRTMGVGVPYAPANVSSYFPEYWVTKNINSSLFSIAALVNSVDWDVRPSSGRLQITTQKGNAVSLLLQSVKYGQLYKTFEPVSTYQL